MDQTMYFVNTVKELWRCVNYARDGVAGSSDLQKWIDLADKTITELNELIDSSSLNIYKKKTCQTSCGQLHSIRRLLNDYLVKVGAGLQVARVTWDDTKSAFKNNLKTSVITNVKHLDISTFMKDACAIFVTKIKADLIMHKSLKVDCILAAEYVIVKDDKEIMEVKYFNTKSDAIYMTTDLTEWFGKNVKHPIERDMEEFQERDSGWSLKAILNLTVNMNKLSPMKATSYIELPKPLRNRKACVNVQNQDNECFKWAVLSALHPIDKDAQRVSKYKAYANELNFKDIGFPVSVTQISKFEKQNDISINLFILKKKGSVFDVSPCHLTALKKVKHVNLLLVQDIYIDEAEDKQQEYLQVPRFHYMWIKDLSRLVSSQLSKNTLKKYLCDRCLHYFHNEDKLRAHEIDCMQMNKCKVLLPKDAKDSLLKFRNFKNKERVPIVIYADFECILKPIEGNDRAFQEHEPFSVGFYVKYKHDENKCQYMSYRREAEHDENPAEWFVSQLCRLAEELESIYKNPISMNNVDKQSFDLATTCHICGGSFNDKDQKVRDHCHLTGVYRGAAHNICNLQYKDSRAIPVVFHNLSGYDSHLFIKQLVNSFKGRVIVIPQNKEKYISFTKYIDGSEINFRFIDSFRFMPSSLDKLASYLEKMEILEKEFKKKFNDHQIQLLRRKGVFPYDHIQSFDILNETSLPDKESFYSSLYESHISDEDYNHAQTVWNIFNIKTLGEYSDLYLKTDVLLLANVFEDFRTMCIDTYQLDPAHYYTTPGFTWDAMLKYTGIQLQLLTDIDMLLFIERGIRGGISQCCNRYAKANNPYMESGYDENKESKYLMYYDVNNLYGWAMTQSLPYNGFKWVEDLSNDFFNVSDDAPVGYILEVDLEYPETLHDAHKDLPLCPEHVAPPGSKQKKLLTTLNNKERYILHYRALKQTLKYGLRLQKIHRAIEFNQKPWLKPYIDLNSKLRKNAKNEFEKMLFKLFNNAVYGKTMENERKRVDVKLVNKWEGRYGCEAYIAQPNFHSCAIFDENLVAVQLSRTEISIRKPIYIGLAVLDLSKTLVYRFHYEYMQERVGDRAKLLYTDTDSLIYEVSNVNMYTLMKTDLHEFDTSDYPANNKFNIPLVNKKKVGLMKDECNGKIMTEFVGLRSKMYSVKVQGQTPIKKIKGVKSSVVKSTIEFDDYIQCLRENICISCEQKNIRSRLHVIWTEKEHKIALSPHDDKRYLIFDQTDTLPWGHCMIEEYQLIEASKKVEADEKATMVKRARLEPSMT